MRRLLIALLAVLLAMSLVPVKAAQAASIIKTEDGLEFKFGLVEKVQFYTLNGADFTDRVPACGGKECNFRSFVSPDSQIGDNTFNLFNFTNLLFDLAKGPVSIHVNLDNEARIDENISDINHLNLERASLTYKTGLLGDLTVGFDVHLFDPEGGLIYQDEDPGIWLIGSQGIVSWNLGYHKRLSRNGGKPLGNLIGGFGGLANGLSRGLLDRDTDIFEARLGFNFPLPGGNLSISPLFLANIRHTAASTGFGNSGIFACPTGEAACTAATNLADSGRAEIYYPGLVVTSKLGPLNITGEAVGMFGEVRELGPNFRAIYGKSELDIESFAIFAEVALDMTAQGLGITPYVNFDYRQGDDKPLDDTLSGYTPISELTQALRKDGFRLQSIQSLGAVTLGNGGEDGWGFNTTGRGIGPTIGTILEDLGASTTFFNNRFGKADNPGMIKISGGVLGKINSQWDMHVGASYIRFDTTESIKEEACRNRNSRGIACPNASALQVREDAGVEFNLNVGFSPVPAFRIQPYVSVFVPLDAAEDIQDLFLGTTPGSANSTRTAYTAGVEFRAQF